VHSGLADYGSKYSIGGELQKLIEFNSLFDEFSPDFAAVAPLESFRQ
jgi:hypothetical protein